MRIFAFGIASGQSIAVSIGEFKNRLAYETNVRHAIEAKAGTMRAITYLGLILFLPLFGAVSSNILLTLSSSYASANLPSTSSLLCAVLSYVFITLFVTAYAYGSSWRIADKLCEVLPLFSMAFSIAFFTSSYIAALI